MFGLAACDDGVPVLVNASVRTITNAREVGSTVAKQMHWLHRHGNMGAPSRQSNGGTTEKGSPGTLEMREGRKRAEDANRICSITHENAENKR